MLVSWWESFSVAISSDWSWILGLWVKLMQKAPLQSPKGFFVFPLLRIESWTAYMSTHLRFYLSLCFCLGFNSILRLLVFEVFVWCRPSLLPIFEWIDLLLLFRIDDKRLAKLTLNIRKSRGLSFIGFWFFLVKIERELDECIFQQLA